MRDLEREATFRPLPAIDVVLLVIAVGVTIHLVTIPTLPRERSR